MTCSTPRLLPGRRGFTLIELLIVISIIAVLMSIILPAIIKVRDAGDKLQCANNLRQIGHATWSHIHQHGYLPTAGTSDYCGPLYQDSTGAMTGALTAAVAGWKQDAGWAFQLLPHLDEEYVWTGYSGTATLNMTAALSNSAAGASTGGGGFKVYVCPSRRGPTPGAYTNSSFPSNYPAATQNVQYTVVPCDYAGCNGQLPSSTTATNVPANDGLILSQYLKQSTGGGRKVVMLRDVTGNHSRILMFGEKAANPRDPLWFTSKQIKNEDDMGYAAAFGSVNTGTTAVPVWSAPVNFNTIRFADKNLLPLRDFEVKGLGTSPTGGAFGSPHPGSWNACMLDGSVQQLSYNMDPNVWGGVGQRSGLIPGTTTPVSDQDLLP
jgi:prepilin-type N-terminal cleavage/methylation domain-containing protein